MTGSAVLSNSSRVRNYQFRDQCILYLRDEGFTSADARPEVKGLPRNQRELLDHGDIVGLPWVLGCRAQQNIDLSGSLDEAKREAERAGVTTYASIQLRKAHSVKDAYVTMPLSVFTDVLRRYGP